MATDENCYEFRSKAQDIDEVKINLCLCSVWLANIHLCALFFNRFKKEKPFLIQVPLRSYANRKDFLIRCSG
jgi:hypothetical protein